MLVITPPWTPECEGSTWALRRRDEKLRDLLPAFKSVWRRNTTGNKFGVVRHLSLLAFLGIVSAFGAMFVIAWALAVEKAVTWLTFLGGILCAIGIPLMFTLVWLKVMNMSVIRFFGATAGVVEELLF